MGAKKKVEPPPPPPPAEKSNNAIIKVSTSEGKELKMNEEMFTKHSPKVKALAESSKDGSVKLE